MHLFTSQSKFTSPIKTSYGVINVFFIVNYTFGLPCFYLLTHSWMLLGIVSYQGLKRNGLPLSPGIMLLKCSVCPLKESFRDFVLSRTTKACLFTHLFTLICVPYRLFIQIYLITVYSEIHSCFQRSTKGEQTSFLVLSSCVFDQGRRGEEYFSGWQTKGNCYDEFS